MSDGLSDALKGCNVISNNVTTCACTNANCPICRPQSTTINVQIQDNKSTVIDNFFKKEIKEGIKHDSNKVPVELLPTQALEEIAKALAFGQKKYNAWNWSQGFKWSRLIGAAIRHLFAWQRGEDIDKESGLSHLAHLGCCVLFLLQHEISQLGTDDRFKGFIKGDKK